MSDLPQSIPDYLREVHCHITRADEIADAFEAMLAALIDLSLIAEMQIEDICDGTQEGELDAVSKMELARWSKVGAAIAKATGGTLTSGETAKSESVS